ncbi:DUF6438 domain-containing protein [Hymenobacter sediminicola]|uniref:DUF6438 domain-containing protein n=1 Tax=Hymenobacter sediminicola TaxID=2761579 RepID=A0A7G7W3Z1_9BACT|nr:DUF6438 domain-containing protein [Hymenobacter sediminicola]QNH61084.1 hypothetical protein H4317_12980 [Hymenobacter sediminicola]
MLKILICCVCIMLFACQCKPKILDSASQEPHSQKLLSRIDSLQTDAQVIRLVEVYAKQDRPVKMHRPDTTLCRRLKSCVDCQTVSSWMKADFDGNGRTDLLVFGESSSILDPENPLICLLDSGNVLPHVTRIGGYSEWLLGFDDFTEHMVPWIVKQKPQDLIAFARNVDGSGAATGTYSCVVDTLILDKGRFIEYNPAPERYSVTRVQLETTECYGSCPVFKMQIDRTGDAKYEALEYNKLRGRFTGVIDAPHLPELWSLINYLKFRQMKDRYAVRATDQQTATLTVTYADGTIKKIEDYGLEGSLGLIQLYKLLFQLRNTQAWYATR